jgi:squalene-hopene/tetraprenyl-beta-curcumene cyclase
LALALSGVPADDPRLRRAGRWMLSKEVKKAGDWRVGTGAIEPGGWFFEYFNEFYPDVDDTIMVLMALEQLDLPEKAGARRRALAWIDAMQCRNGGWASFDADNDREWLTRLPFADHNAMIDPATADITARVLEMYGRLGEIESRPGTLRRARTFVKRDQKPDGSWFGRWGVNYLYGTWQVLEGMAAVGENMTQPWLVRGANWIEYVQNPDGGWGESIRGYENPEGFKPAESMPAQTAWALMGLIAAGRAEGDSARRGVEYLVRTQAADGAWDEPLYTGTGFPKVFYLCYPMYRKYFPLMALGKYLKAVR